MKTREEEFAELRATVEEATPGPWWIGGRDTQGMVMIEAPGCGRNPAETEWIASTNELDGDTDARFIAASHPKCIKHLLDYHDELVAALLNAGDNICGEFCGLGHHEACEAVTRVLAKLKEPAE